MDCAVVVVFGMASGISLYFVVEVPLAQQDKTVFFQQVVVLVRHQVVRSAANAIVVS